MLDLITIEGTPNASTVARVQRRGRAMIAPWIKMRANLLESPQVIAIAAATGLEDYAVVGRLQRRNC